MNHMSWTERRERRGGITELEFLAGMERAGFVEVPTPQIGARHEFQHPSTGDRRYVVDPPESFGRAFTRCLAELQQ
jgi:hypothetical protein